MGLGKAPSAEHKQLISDNLENILGSPFPRGVARAE